MFSPYYKRARWGGPTDPENHVSINVALYGPGGRWSMTERGRHALTRDATHFSVGPSALEWDGSGLTIDIDEITVPVPRRLRGSIRLWLDRPAGVEALLDPLGRHRWRPILPHAPMEVSFSHPALSWQGTGYFDHNLGTEPIERGFRSWTWSRAPTRSGAAVLYDVVRRDGSTGGFALGFGPDGPIELAAPPEVALPRTLWGIQRPARSAGPARVVRTLEDTPFYARSLAELAIEGETVTAFHESLSLQRFERGIVQAMLPFRMPRRAMWRR